MASENLHDYFTKKQLLPQKGVWKNRKIEEQNLQAHC